jgi:hypothetical protein
MLLGLKSEEPMLAGSSCLNLLLGDNSDIFSCPLLGKSLLKILFLAVLPLPNLTQVFL